ncbi:MAG: hypothetical protein CMN76_06025 [Spirochaetaceae bacterium]|nr:hypothetical protein [Spirochaetaceae bacterium]
MRTVSRLPLSWCLSSCDPNSGSESSFIARSLWLPRSRRDWIYNAQQSRTAYFADIMVSESAKKDIILRGCDASHLAALEDRGWKHRQSGLEAVLPLRKPDPWNPHRSLRELSRRALRKGNIEVMERPDPGTIGRIREILTELRNASQYRRRPALKYLFQNDPEFWELCLIYYRDNQPEALVGWSRNGESAIHLEVMLRSREAPVGAMEALILESVALAGKRGMELVSLGEVPFLRINPKTPELPAKKQQTQLKRFASYYLMRPAFSSMGLFRFKNKFRPLWNPLYLMSNRPVGLLALGDLFIESGCHKLLAYCLTHFNRS